MLALYSHRDLEGFRRAVPGIFLDLIPADYFSLCDSRIDLQKRSTSVLDIWESRTLCVGGNRAALERNLFDHPFTQHVLAHNPDGALLLSDFLTLPQLRRTRLYREALRPVGIGRLLSVGAMGGPGLATLSVTRPETAPDFTERDRQMLEMLRPHFDQARANLERETLRRATRSQSLEASGLTPRETQVALWLAQGKSNPEIATILGAPVRTVEKHVEHILHKLGVENRSAAAVAVARIIRG
jgi:DNA-binding CsgD family transcriptional regulator